MAWCGRTRPPGILAKRSDVLSPRMMRLIEDPAGDWRRLDERIEGLSTDITSLVEQDPTCERLMAVPGIGPIISSATVAAIGTGDVFSKGRDFAAWLGLVPRQISTGDRTSSARYQGCRSKGTSGVHPIGILPKPLHVVDAEHDRCHVSQSTRA
jgi:transposase